MLIVSCILSDVQADLIPVELRRLPQWLVWQFGPPDKKTGKRPKVPYNPITKRMANPTDAAEWTTFAKANAAAGYEGVGFALAEGGGIVGIDIDRCRDPETGLVAPWAQRYIDLLDTTTELSPSGTGFHLFAYGSLPDEGSKFGPIEMYQGKRFLTVTGRHVEGTPRAVEHRQEALTRMHGEVGADHRVISQLQGERKARELWSGTWEDAYPSRSEADLALCGRLAALTAGDAEQVDRLFRRSGLMREKWDENRGDQTYGEMTVAEVLRSYGVAQRGGLADDLAAEEVLNIEGKPLGATVVVTHPNGVQHTVFMPVEAVVAQNPAVVLHTATGIPWTPTDARAVQTWLAGILTRDAAVARVEAMRRPRWEGERILIPNGDVRLVPSPGAEWLTEYGRKAPVDEERARAAWRAIARTAVRHPRLMVALGAAAASVYLQPLERNIFFVHIVGESTQGKTLALRTAMAQFGDPDRLVRSWNTTRNASQERLAAASILPVALDETGAAGVRDEVLEAIVFGTASGTSRGRARADGGLRAEVTWKLVAISTGERRLTTASGLTGARRRVVEIQSPVTPTREVIDRLAELAAGHHGWPATWLRRDPGLATVRADLASLEPPLLADAADGVTRELAKHLAMCAAGFGALCRWCGEQIPHGGVLDAARTVLKECADVFDDEGLSVADRLLNALFEDEVRNVLSYPERQYSTLANVGERGFDLGDRLAVYPKILREIAEEVGILDPSAALRELRRRGVLVPGTDGTLQRQVKVKMKNTRLFVFERISPLAVDDDLDEALKKPGSTPGRS